MPRQNRSGDIAGSYAIAGAPVHGDSPRCGPVDSPVPRALIRPLVAAAPAKNRVEADPLDRHGLDFPAASVAVEHPVEALVRLHLFVSSPGGCLLAEAPYKVSAGAELPKERTSGPGAIERTRGGTRRATHAGPSGRRAGSILAAALPRLSRSESTPTIRCRAYVRTAPEPSGGRLQPTRSRGPPGEVGLRREEGGR